VISTTLESMPKNATHWTTHGLTQRLRDEEVGTSSPPAKSAPARIFTVQCRGLTTSMPSVAIQCKDPQLPVTGFSLDALKQTRHAWVALLTGLLVALLGLYPHLRWSVELNQVAWFYNSYDEGYYGWLSLTGLTAYSLVSELVMHGLYFVSGSNAQLAMILADFLLPLGVTLASCYLVRPLFASAGGMAAGALFVMVSAECLALRSTSIPHSSLHRFLQEKILSMGGGSEGIMQLGNQTSTFWLFRTPEPQVSWIIMFIVLGLALRLAMATPEQLPRWVWFAACLLVGTGYLFCALSVSCVLFLFSAAAVKSHLRHSFVAGAGGLVCFAVCIGLSVYVAGQSGGESLVFRSHRPVVMISVILGLLAVGCTLVRGHFRGQFGPVHLFSIALGLTPLFIANQQVVTGHMIYLLNFENFGLAQVSALALLAAIFSRQVFPLRSGETKPITLRTEWLVAAGPLLACLLMGGIILRSQILSYANYLPENRLGRSYELAMEALPITGELIACDDFFQTDTLAIRLGHRPEYLIARDMTFTKPIARLKNPQDIPRQSGEARQALYRYLALTGVSPDELSKRFGAITDPDNPSWQDRFMLGGFLYNYADFWAPLTHGRDARLAWIEAQKTMIVENYAQFLLKGNTATGPVIFLMRQDKPAPSFLANHHAQPLAIPPLHSPIPMKAYRIAADADHGDGSKK
jgi:hypothetical protein